MTSSTAASASSTQYLARPEGRIAYDLQGAGPLLVLVPGMGELRSSYRFLTPALVAAGYTVVTTDLRGHGDSDTTFSGYGDIETASDIQALIAQLGRPAVIVGNSLAAGAAVIVAAEHPAQVDGLVLVGPFVRNPPSNVFTRGLFRVMMAPLWIAPMWKSYMPTLYAGRKPADFEEYRTAVIASLKRKSYGKAFSLTTQQTTHDPAEAKLSAVTAPTLVIMGDKDPDFKDPAAEARFVADALHGSVVMVADAGHYPQAQQPDITAAAVLGFVKTLPRA
ncbi:MULTISPECIES: alpha/beta fold hydrolase [unclassified Cryobacterium]|uniref:alpha/beta fold hydrolase n=1 Tax=unclassified Cryobacterium TaxID=2649013 RepID=UPI001068F620|nr:MULTISPECIES: alpha/beta hydrolase [unclassified Cryobacterium]TFB99267.1 alpha/beta hydrolase [Cryobacterium sp. MDB2-A-1]TFC02160.1 alpha/beta hydrolase [Cryobacterium sp. MDB2-33-2]TFC15886.1 alpha/beta hydrolase [Cryobacterium sp. MDB2-A-2]TFC16123.1 alpha/beta hydrolase [Cryobacterium sp. MDB2-10]